MAAKLQTYSVLVRIDAVTDIELKAENWEQALQKALALRMDDACSLTGSYIDGDGVSLESIYAPGAE